MDRPEFTHNPSSCEASQLDSTLGGSGATSPTPPTTRPRPSPSTSSCSTASRSASSPSSACACAAATRRGAYPAAARDLRLARAQGLQPEGNRGHACPTRSSSPRTTSAGSAPRSQFDAEQLPGRLGLRHTPSPTRRSSTNRCSGNVYLRSSPGTSSPTWSPTCTRARSGSSSKARSARPSRAGSRPSSPTCPTSRSNAS